MTSQKAALAARNNALWCDAMCRAHGQTTEFTDHLWICRGAPPRYHSNLTTLQSDSLEAVKIEAPGGFKDGFYDIDASEFGYRLLFEASWIWNDSAKPRPMILDWPKVQTDQELIAWEVGWAVGDEGAANHPRQFPPNLLDNPDNAFLGGYKAGKLLAGCILNLTEPVVGLSNTFSLGIELADLWHDLPLAANQAFPGIPIVGYERGQDLESALAAGFQAVGPLRVWYKP